MRRARRAILDAGGADAVNSFTRYYLALLGQISYDLCPAVPPEIVLLAEMVSGESLCGERLVADDHRAAVDHLGVSAGPPHRAAAGHPRAVPARAGGLAAAAVSGAARRPRPAELGPFLPRGRPAAKWCQRRAAGCRLRRKALEAAERWMIARFDRSDGLGAIYPPMVWSIDRPEMPGLSRRQPGGRIVSPRAAKLAIEDPRRGHDPAAALQIAGLGHGHRRPRAGGRRRGAPRIPVLREAVAWLLAQQNSAAGRLVGNRGRRAGRMVFRVHQRLLSRLRRHGHGADGAAHAIFRPAGAGAHCRPTWRWSATRLIRRPRPYGKSRTSRKSFSNGSSSWRIRRRRSSAGSAGSWPCRTATAAGARLIATTTASSSATSPSPTITP